MVPALTPEETAARRRRVRVLTWRLAAVAAIAYVGFIIAFIHRQ